MRIISAVVNAPAASAPAPAQAMAMDALLPAVEQALQRAGIGAADLDMIVTLSLAPNRLAIDAAIIGPRIGHPLQKQLGAANAYVFDLMDTSVAKALHVVDVFGHAQGYRRALFLRVECGQDVRADMHSGFAIPDGAMALVCEPDGKSSFCSDDLAGIEPLMILMNTEVSRVDDKKGFIRFAPPEKLGPLYLAAAREGLARLGGSAGQRHVIEHWDLPSRREPGAARHQGGPFDIGLALSELLGSATGGELAAVSLDLFGPGADTVTLSYERPQ